MYYVLTNYDIEVKQNELNGNVVLKHSFSTLLHTRQMSQIQPHLPAV